MIPVFRPYGTDEEAKAAEKVIKSGYWGCGPECAAFEKEFSQQIGIKYCLATTSCTAALIMTGKILNLPVKSEIIIPAITWISTAYLAEHNNLKVVFADVEGDTLNIDPIDVEQKITNRTKAIVIMHHGGHACDIDKIKKLTKKYNLYLIEDCAHGLGGTYKGKPLGSFGDISCFSFQAVKSISTGDGGMVATNNKEWADRIRSLRWLGMDVDSSQRNKGGKYSWQHDIIEVGYKYQLNDILAAIGRVQLKRLSEMNKQRAELISRYNDRFREMPWIKTPIVKKYTIPSNHIYVIKVNESKRDRLMEHLASKGIHTSVHYKPLYHYSIYKDRKVDCPVADNVWKELVTIPLYACMTYEEQAQVIKAILDFKS